MKKITFFRVSLSSGGAEHQLCILANFLAKKGYDVTIVTFADIEDFYFLDPVIKRIRLAQGMPKWKKFVAIVNFFIRTNTDVAIGFGAFSNFLMFLPLLFNKKCNVKIAGERNSWYGKLPWYVKFNIKYLFKSVDYVVTNSYCQANQIIAKAPKLENKLVTIVNYTDTSLYKVLPIHRRNRLEIGIFARYERQKNFHRLLEAIHILKERGYSNFHISCYGNLHNKNVVLQQYIDESKELISKYGVGDLITMNDKTRNVPDLIPLYDILCLPSLYEGFSNAISEYICCGRPVLCSDVADNGIMVKDGYNGFLFDPKNVESMVEAFKKMLQLTYEERIEMGKRSREIAENLFKKESFLNTYIDLIEGKRQV